MQNYVSALLIHDQAHPFEALKWALKNLPVHISSVRTFREARQRIVGENPPDLIFTQPSLEDGTWEDVVDLAWSLGSARRVVVVAGSPNVRLSVSVARRGALGLMVPPFQMGPLGYVLSSVAPDANEYESPRMPVEEQVGDLSA